MKTLEERFWAKVDKRGPDECWPWTGATTREGYGHFYVIGKTGRAHRVSWELKNGKIPPHGSHHGYCICHHCDNPSCQNPAHLFLGTNKDNVTDKVNKGRHHTVSRPGSKNPQSKLTETDVIEIRRMLAHGGLTQRWMAKLYKVHFSTINSIAKGNKWRHVD